MPNSPSMLPRRIKSFVRREGRITRFQQQALKDHWSSFGVSLQDEQSLHFFSLFHRDAPTILEIGFGNGESLLETAVAHPELNFIGIEVHRPGVGRLLAQIAKANILNLKVICEDAVKVLTHHIPDESLQGVHIFFPDPWPKKRHHKRRLIQPEFCTLLGKKIQPGGYVHLATDWEHYAFHMLEVISACPLFTNKYGEGCFASSRQGRPLTKFEERGKKLGHSIWELVVVKESKK